MRTIINYFILFTCISISAVMNVAFAQADGNGKTVLITGANRGLGFEFARQFSEKGYNVIGTARTPGEAHELRALDVRIVQLDVADTASVKAMAAELEGTGIDILINNAGISGQHGGLTDLDADRMDYTFQVNTLGPMRVTRALYDNLLMGEERTVIHITSIMGSIELNDRGGAYGYRMSKTALNMFNKNLSLELAGKGFICVVMHPGWVQTDMGGEQAPLEPEQSISDMIEVIEGLERDDNGRFYDHSGKELPW